MIEAIDSHYMHVRNRIKTLNPDRKILGVMDAMDWPSQVVDFEALYCISLGEVPIDKEGDSISIPILIHTVQWTWLILGTNVQAGIQIRSRGDKYRKNYQIEKEVLYGTFPRYTQKMTVTADGNGVLQSTPIDPAEFIVWSPVSFVKRGDKSSGLIYGTATVRITNMTDQIVA